MTKPLSTRAERIRRAVEFDEMSFAIPAAMLHEHPNEAVGEWYVAGARWQNARLRPYLELLVEMAEALEQVEEHNSEGINALVRGFVGNAESDLRESQAETRAVLAKLDRLIGDV